MSEDVMTSPVAGEDLSPELLAALDQAERSIAAGRIRPFNVKEFEDKVRQWAFGSR
jgi:hypothetical protein